MIRIPVFPQGTRVRIRPSPRFPLDPELQGRTGLVLVRRQRGRPDKVGVQLDGEDRIRVFHVEELESLEPGLDLSQAGSARP
jgi:hypothetical protein